MFSECSENYLQKQVWETFVYAGSGKAGVEMNKARDRALTHFCRVAVMVEFRVEIE